MTLTPTALLLLSVQRHHLTDRPDERQLSREWLQRVEEARAARHLVVLVQWDGEAGSDSETFSKGWTLYPDFRAEAGELLVRATQPDAFAGSDLDAALHSRAVRELRLLGLDGEELQVTAQTARRLGYAVQILQEAGA
ncbi:Nicotinamidase-related amidase [Deinococcus reticulitermitis]|uniref:Nicotinamidase-related amidase n=1 Tax=Deinococcus reticulitermitis TaxID=856736 RepID=A0A1H7BR71_9DEIO|nr:isochorismatase family protein [Deinococcus reticulitermitis]SEJ80089.1 Nicotinamidase-related amidase [Deinococcus reticulitermitis]